jgi:hypothetical protein
MTDFGLPGRGLREAFFEVADWLAFVEIPHRRNLILLVYAKWLQCQRVNSKIGAGRILFGFNRGLYPSKE